MKKFLNIFATFLLLLITTQPLAQSAPPFDPFQDDLPSMVVAWGSGSCTNPGPKRITSDADADAICNTYSTASERWCSALGIDYQCCIDGDTGNSDWDAGDIRGWLQDMCKKHWRATKAKMKGECDYIEAYQVGFDFTAVTWGGGVQYTLKRCFFSDPSNPTPDTAMGINECSSDYVQNACSDDHNVGAPTVCANGIYGVKFRIKRNEQGCENHDWGSSQRRCRECYEDRGYLHAAPTDPADDADSNPVRDPKDPVNSNGNAASSDDITTAGGYIYSQGCMPQSASNAILSIGSGNGDIDIGEVFNLTQDMNFSNLLRVMAPSCLFDWQETNAKYQEFEGHDNTSSPQSQQVYQPIDATYSAITAPGGDIASPAKMNPYKGNCGRGKFFYKNLVPQDSNKNIVDPSLSYVVESSPEWQNLRIGSNDIWESRTGCYNPEERFVIFPTGKVEETIKFNEPNRMVTQPTDVPIDVLAAAVANVSGSSSGAVVLTEYGRKFVENIQRYNNFLSDPMAYLSDDTADPWDAPADKFQNGGSQTIYNPDYRSGEYKPDQIDTASPASYLVPNDRLLMRHPMCINEYNQGFSGPLNFQQFNNLGSKVNTMEKVRLNSTDIDRIYNHGSIPVCLANEALDEVDAFCRHYFQKSNKLEEVGGVAVPIPLHANYGAIDKYVFNYENFCWERDNLNYNIVPFDPYEHYLPLALKLDPSQLTGIDIRPDIFGNAHMYEKTDYRRPHLTEYAARVVQDSGVDPDLSDGDQSEFYHKYLSLEEYGYRDVPIAKSDYTIDPLNIYRPDALTPITAEELYKIENRGRKSKMQQCLRLFIEQWAFEGDKGAIVLDTYKKVERSAVGAITPDASMCQWAAYYDTSDNYGREEMLDFEDVDDFTSLLQINKGKERNLFKTVMLYYFSQVQEKNKEYRDSLSGDHEDYTLGYIIPVPLDSLPMHLPPPLLAAFTHGRLRAHFQF